jgi:hypothetical protein
MKKLSLIALLTIAGATSSAQAQKAKAGAVPAAGGAAAGEENTQYKAKTVYDFEDDMVEGDLHRPDGELINSVKGPKHSSLIEIRKDFIPEMLKSLEDV